MLPAMAVIFLGWYALKEYSFRSAFAKYSMAFLSLFLLFVTTVETLIIFLVVILLTYAGCHIGKKLQGYQRKLFQTLLIVLQLLPLLYYKYANFIANDVCQQEWDTVRNLVIPIGISFYTFQSIAFCIDTLRDQQRIPKFIDYLNFCSFFPQIVAGPIERRSSLLPQMENLRLSWDSQNMVAGLPFVVLGLFYKMVMANNLSAGMLNGYAGENAFPIWVNNVCFGFRIYFDFAGYGLTAYGIAKCLGINITMNFLSPYTCCNISDFWRNWHRSLTLWFRDYIYFSMGGSRTKLWWFNIIVMFLVSGIWHGAGWNFIIWGILGGVTMVIHRIFSKRGYSLPRFLGWVLTFSVMMFIWMFFYEVNMDIVLSNLATVLNPSSYDIGGFISHLQNHKSAGAIAVVFIPISFVTIFLEFLSTRKYADPYRIFTKSHACMIMVVLIFMLYSHTPSQFIYFAF